MPTKKKKQFGSSMVRHIKASQKQVTVMFTDIEGSTRYWDTRGDIKGRLMVDTHNRLIFPVIRKFNGKVVKTIGDSIMAVFNKPDKAVSASIGIQQMLRKNRELDENFTLKVRIGIHTGMAIVEHNDVFGDVVNVASRVESQGSGDDILISEDTAGKIKKKMFNFVRGGSFTPKGKKKVLKVFRCKWMNEKDLIKNIRVDSFLPLTTRQKIELLVYTFASVGILYFLYLEYFRYLIADEESLALFSLDPHFFINMPPYVPAIIGTLCLVIMILLIRRATVPHFIMSLLQGGFGFGIGFLLVYLPVVYFEIDVGEKLSTDVYQSKHLFVEVLENNSVIHEKPAEKSKTLQVVNAGDLLLLTDVKKIGKLTWNKVLVGKKEFGWILRVVPPKMGVPEKRVTYADKFYFKTLDLIEFILGLIGFIWGVWKFKIRPV